MDVPPPSEAQDSALATITDLPNEILLRILGDLDDRTLYNHISLGRSLHGCALHILFERRLSDLKIGRLWLNGHAPYLLPALHGALSLPDLPHFFIWFDEDPGRLLTEIRILTDLVSRFTRNETMHISLNRVSEKRRTPYDTGYPSAITNMKDVTRALQGLLDAGLEKGCRTINLDTGPGFKILCNRAQVTPVPQFYRPTTVAAIAPVWSTPPPKKRKRTFSQVIAGLFKPHHHPQPVDTIPTPEAATEAETQPASQPEPLPKEPEKPLEPPPPPFPVKREWHSKAMMGGTLTLSTDVVFEPMWTDWTLCLLNQTRLSTIQLHTSHFSKNALRDVFPKIQIPHLTAFEISGDNVFHDDLAPFLKRHSDTLTRLKLDIRGPERRLSYFPPGSEPPLVTDFDLPKLETLALTPHVVEWFLETISASRVTTFQRALAKIDHIDLTLSVYMSSADHFSKIDEALRAIAKFTAAEWPKIDVNSDNSDYTWFSHIVIDTSGFATLSYTEWFKLHAENPRTSAFTSLTTLRQLHIYNSSGNSSFSDKELDILPGFLALFKKLNQFGVAAAEMEKVKKRKPEYWKRIWRACPTLRMLSFHWSSTFRMGDLVNGQFISTSS
ncbi:hypothetical protein BDN72DRAFT_841936 [Pluteus cervinus]|uniref:Uncharacterized protein n=1 Tax=Pluteus cervinus TaxID=181527 RepID=A0ACD3ARC3_9AGAR|nr:hypothetical protein BDN72DRAFT_841936 [Pluteus cervinus]